MCSSTVQLFSFSARIKPVNRKTGFTLIELLVVIAIIGILIGMTLPAVQYVRESARRVECANNLKQMGIAMHDYEIVNGHFPPAYVAEEHEPGWSWGTFLLPFVEQKNLFDLGDSRNLLFGGGDNPAAMPTEYSTKKVTLYRCPSDFGDDINDIRLSHATSNYRAVAGPVTHFFFEENKDMGGVMYQNSNTKMTRISDGTSNTVILGECIFDPVVDKRAALWAGMTGRRGNSIWISDCMWWIDEESAVINGPAPQAFSSQHPGGAMFAFGDSSTRFFREGGDVDVLRFLGGREDGTIINPGF